jgi:hypothetical protein
MVRVRLEELKAIVDRINEITGQNPHRVGVGPGFYYLQGAYGGYQLQQVVEGSAVRAITSGFRPKRELRDLLHAYLAGLQSGK